MNITRVLISYKQTTYQIYAKQRPTERMKQLLCDEHPIARDMANAHLIHRQSIAHVKAVLRRYKIACETKRRNFLEAVDQFDLIISIGGDGTFLRTSHFIHRSPPILGINSSPSHSVGALCSITSQEFEAKLVDILEDRVRTAQWTRLVCHLNGQRLEERILNDALVTNDCPAAATRYIIRDSRRTRLSEEQKSSGVWIATPTGSTAAIGAAGGQLMSRRDVRQFQYVVREPYTPYGNPYRLVHSSLRHRDHVAIVSQMGEGAIYIDGPRVRYPFNFGDEAIFTLSEEPLQVIV